MAGQLQMFVVRIHHRNGEVRSYNFNDMGKADAVAKMLAEAKIRVTGSGREPPASAAPCHFFDDAGHEVWDDGMHIASVELVDVEAEAHMYTLARIIAGRTERNLLIRAGEMPDPAKQPPPERPGRAAPSDFQRQPDQPSPGNHSIARFAT